MKKILALAALVLALSVVASAETISESKFSELGYNDFSVLDSNKEDCSEYQFLKGANQNSEEYYDVVSLHGEFAPIASRDAKISVYLSSERTSGMEEIGKANSTDFKSGWLRIVLPGEKLSEQNLVRVCLRTSFSTSSATIKSDSAMGTYKMADFSKPGAMVESVTSTEPVVGEQITVTVTAKNMGSEGTNATLHYWDVPMLETSMKVVGGQTSKTEFLEPGQSTTMVYQVKAKRPVQMSLPRAIVTFTNVFGEEQSEYSNYQTLYVKQPPFLVSATILPDSESNPAGKSVPISIAVKNNGTSTIYNLGIEINAHPEGLSLGDASQTILELEPKEIKYLKADALSSQAGKYELGCSIVYLENPELKGSCALQAISFENPAAALIVGAIVILALISAIIFLYIHFR